MQIPLESLIDGMMRTLREEVLPAVENRRARSQVWCVIDVLNNLRDTVEAKAAPLVEDAEAATAALVGVVQTLREGDRDAEAETVSATLADVPDEPPAARSAALHAAFVRTLEIIDPLPDEVAEALDPVLRSYLLPQAIRDVARLKPSLLGEISKG